MNITRRLSATKREQLEIAKQFPTEDGKPLNLSTVSNYLNEKWTTPKALKIREYAMSVLGCKWVTTIED